MSNGRFPGLPKVEENQNESSKEDKIKWRYYPIESGFYLLSCRIKGVNLTLVKQIVLYDKKYRAIYLNSAKQYHINTLKNSRWLGPFKDMETFCHYAELKNGKKK